MRPESTRAVRARAIRDHLLPLMREKGSFASYDNRPAARFLQCRIGPFSMSLHTPFTPLPVYSAPLTGSYEDAVLLQNLAKSIVLPVRARRMAWRRKLCLSNGRIRTSST